MSLDLESSPSPDPDATHRMLQKLAYDYSTFFKVDLYPSISKLQEFLEESAAKLDELSSLFDMTEAETNDWIEKTLPEIIHVALEHVTDVKRRIDTLEELMQAIKVTLDKQEAQIIQAEHAFAGNSSSLRSVLNYFRKSPEIESIPKTTFESVTINVDSYFCGTG